MVEEENTFLNICTKKMNHAIFAEGQQKIEIRLKRKATLKRKKQLTKKIYEGKDNSLVSILLCCVSGQCRFFDQIRALFDIFILV